MSKNLPTDADVVRAEVRRLLAELRRLHQDNERLRERLASVLRSVRARRVTARR